MQNENGFHLFDVLLLLLYSAKQDQQQQQQRYMGSSHPDSEAFLGSSHPPRARHSSLGGLYLMDPSCSPMGRRVWGFVWTDA